MISATRGVSKVSSTLNRLCNSGKYLREKAAALIAVVRTSATAFGVRLAVLHSGDASGLRVTFPTSCS